MPQPQDKSSLLEQAQQSYSTLMDLITSTESKPLETDFEPLPASTKCTTFAQGNNLRDLLAHAYEWQQLQSAFVANIRNGQPQDFIPDPYRKNYKEMDQANWQRHQSTPLDKSIALLQGSHKEMIDLMETFTQDELFGKKVFKVTYTTTMAAYFISVTISPYTQILKRLKSHLRKCKA